MTVATLLEKAALIGNTSEEEWEINIWQLGDDLFSVTTFNEPGHVNRLQRIL